MSMIYDEKWSYSYEEIEEYVLSCGARRSDDRGAAACPAPGDDHIYEVSNNKKAADKTYHSRSGSSIDKMNAYSPEYEMNAYPHEDQMNAYPHENQMNASSPEEAENIYILDDCIITLQAFPDRPLGRLVFPSTRIRIEGPGADRFYHGFRLRFLSGGG